MKYLKELRNKKGVSQQIVADYLEITRQAYSNYESGNREPDNETLLKLAEFFETTVDALLRGKEKERPHSKGVQIPVLGRVVAGIPLEAIEEILDYEEIPEEMTQHGEYFALQIKGSSMEPRFTEGDVVIIRKQEDVNSGDIAVVLVNGDEATIKRVKKTVQGITLIPTNPAFEPMFYSNQEIMELPVRVLGKVVELRAKF